MNKMEHWIAFAVLVSATVGLSQAADMGDIKGGWVAEGVDCSALETYADERIMKITDSMIEGYESECAISSIDQEGATYTIGLLCEGEGETFRSTLVVELRNHDSLGVKDGFNYKRCP